jgi:hypothetical protein
MSKNIYDMVVQHVLNGRVNHFDYHMTAINRNLSVEAFF